VTEGVYELIFLSSAVSGAVPISWLPCRRCHHHHHPHHHHLLMGEKKVFERCAWCGCCRCSVRYRCSFLTDALKEDDFVVVSLHRCGVKTNIVVVISADDIADDVAG
jgi:hypothetical protein